MSDQEISEAAPAEDAQPGTTDPAAPTGPSFAELGLGPAVLTALSEMGFTHPMKVQAEAIPRVQAGRDLMVQSRTGSGKTAAFGIPLVDKVVRAEDKFVQAIILLPTRELALQVASELTRIATHSGITVVPVYGGAPMGRQIEQLKAGGQIVCGTPGRVMDHMRRGTLVLDRVRSAILDECDEMLSMGFQEDIETILEHTPSDRQTLLFSATVPEGIQRLARRFLRDPENLKLSADFVGVQEIRHVYYTIPGGQRENELLRVLQFENPGRAIVFCNTREETGRVAEFLRRQGYDAEAISSDLAQNDRERVMGRMRAGEIRFLVATDVAARGIDLEALSHVINYTFPESPEVYIHRTGRTGRAGRHGTAISLIGPTEVGAFYYVKLLYKIKPEERSLPSEAEIRSKREGERIEALRARVTSEPGNTWRSLARRLMAAVDGERLCAALLAEAFAGEKGRETAAAPAPVVTSEAAAEPRRDPSRRERFRDRGDRPDRGRSGERERSREGERSRPERPRDFEARNGEAGRDSNGRPEAGERPRYGGRREERDGERSRSSDRSERSERRTRETARTGDEGSARAESTRPERESNGRAPAPAETEASGSGSERAAFEGRERPGSEERRSRYDRPGGERGDRPRSERADRPRGEFARGEGASRERAAGSKKPAGDQEFWSVWSDEPGRASAPEAAEPGTIERAAERPAEEVDVTAGEARLFLNLGRKDDASPDEVSALFAGLGVNIPAGAIDVMNTHSYVNVPAAEADRLCQGLSGRDRNGRALICERARPRRR